MYQIENAVSGMNKMMSLKSGDPANDLNKGFTGRHKKKSNSHYDFRSMNTLRKNI